MSYFLAGVLLLVLYGIFRLLNVSSESTAPKLYFKRNNSCFLQDVLKACPILLEPYIPPLLWGKSGHLQTIIYGKLGRVMPPLPKGRRQHIVMEDGATMTFDIFESTRCHPTGGDYTILVCPGIANSSESSYICTFVDYACDKGYRAAVLNHLGAMKSVPLTAPRMYSYGGTEEFHLMTEEVKVMYPGTSLLAVGFSMGANMVVKYLGEDDRHQSSFLCAMSIGQGYDVKRALPLLSSWTNFRRGYLYAMTLHQKSLLRHHHDNLFNETSRKLYGEFDLQQIYAATSMVDLDEVYVRRRLGFSNVDDFYTWCSSSQYIENVSLPMFILNALDDPLVPEELLSIPKAHAENTNNTILAITQHGGHLGFFEKGFLVPNRVTWLDRVIIQYADAIVAMASTPTASNKIRVPLITRSS